MSFLIKRFTLFVCRLFHSAVTAMLKRSSKLRALKKNLSTARRTPLCHGAQFHISKSYQSSAGSFVLTSIRKVGGTARNTVTSRVRGLFLSSRSLCFHILFAFQDTANVANRRRRTISMNTSAKLSKRSLPYRSLIW